MLQNISVFHFLIFAVTVGFISAIIYTNIQRTALSKFIIYLVSNKCDCEENAVSLDKIGLSAIETRIITSAVTKTHGLKRCVCVIKTDEITDSKLEQLLERSNSSKYYLTYEDKELLLKKYSFSTMPVKQIMLFIAALIAVVITMTVAVDWLIGYISIPKTDKNDKEETIQSEDNNSQTENTESDDLSIYDDIVPDTEQNNIKPSGPRIPV